MVEGDPDMGQQPIIWLIFPPPHGMEIKTIKPEASGEGWALSALETQIRRSGFWLPLATPQRDDKPLQFGTAAEFSLYLSHQSKLV